MFESMYLTTERDRAPFGKHWNGPTSLPHGEEILIAVYRKAGGDGQRAEVYCIACPARFYVIKALAGRNSVGVNKPAYSVSTGSSAGELAASIAQAISEGMLDFEAEQSQPEKNLAKADAPAFRDHNPRYRA